MKGKKGLELSMNVVVVAIVALIVLLIVAVIFVGGISNVFLKMKEFLAIGTGGKSVEFARSQCELACSMAETASDPSKSYYCTNLFELDTDGDGKADSGKGCRSLGASCSIENACSELSGEEAERTERLRSRTV